MRLLIADGDAVFSLSLQRALEQRGFLVETTCDGRIASDRMQLKLVDACVLGTDLWLLESMAALRLTRLSGATLPILILASLQSSADRVRWFEAGADDILGRPFDIEELSVRLRGLHRRSAERGTPPALRCGPLDLDILSGSFLLHGELFELTPSEHALLRALIMRPGFPVPKDRLCRAALAVSVSPSALDVLACRLRRRLAGTGVVITTVRGVGYLLETESASQNQRRRATSAPLPLRLMTKAPEVV